MTEDATPGALGPLVACPLCGERKGYTLHEGTSYRWWRVCCGHCGADVAECRSDGGTTLGRPKPERWPAADHAWKPESTRRNCGRPCGN